MNPFGHCRQELAHAGLHGPTIPDAKRRRKTGEVEAVEGKSPVELARAARERVCKVARTIPDALSAVQAGASHLPAPAPGRGEVDHAPGSGPAPLLRAGFSRLPRATTRGLGSL